MKIKAVRLRDVGMFRKPVALEGFSGGLDVLAGANEFGKSTIFRALKFLLLNKHTAGGNKLSALAPYDGGAPLIEADIEFSEGTWRITKQFGRNKKSELRNLSGGGLEASGPDADARLAELIGIGSGMEPARLNLLWIAQKEGLAAPQLETSGERSVVMSAIDSEIANIAGGPLARDVRKRVLAALDAYVTKTLKVKKDGPLDLARRHRDAVSARLDEARLLQKQTAQWRDEAAQLRQRRTELLAPGVRDGLVKREDELRQQIATNAKQRETLNSARERRDGKRQGRQMAVSALTSFDGMLDEFMSLEAEARKDEQVIGGVKDELTKADETLATAQVRETTLRDEDEALTGALQANAAREKRDQALTTFDARSRVYETAKHLSQDMGKKRAALAEVMLDPSVFEELSRLGQRIRVAEAQIEAASPVVDITYREGVKSRFIIDGETVDQDRSISVFERISIEVPGVGLIRVSPAENSDQAEIEKRLADDKAKLASILAAAGAPNVDSVLAMKREQEEAGTRLREIAAELKAIAPDGIAALETEVAKLSGDVEVSGDFSEGGSDPVIEGAEQFDSTVAAERVSAVRVELKEVLAQVARGREERERLVKRFAQMKATAEARDKRRDALTDKLGDNDTRMAVREKLANELADADAAMVVAEKAYEALEPVLEGEALADLEARARTAIEALTSHDTEAKRVEQSLFEIETQVRAADDSGVGVQVGRLEGELELASKEYALIEEKVGALKLLLETLDEAAESAQAHIAAPVIARLEPYLKALFPDAMLAFGEGLRVTSLSRGVKNDPVHALSDGTVEQLALTVRLAYARLLADTGSPVPLLLDDPLAYADDERLARSFDALKLGAKAHQVIVLTCRKGAFEQLGGTKLTLGPWDDAA